MARRNLRIAVAIAMPLCLAAGAHAQSYDLRANWSDAQNPNGTWVYRDAAGPLPAVSAWQGAPWAAPQAGWARAASLPGAYLPFCFRSNGGEDFAHDWLAGDIVMHTANWPLLAPVETVVSGVAWGSPLDGMVKIIGGVWPGRVGARSHWARLLHNQDQAAVIFVVSPRNSRANPQHFTDGLIPGSSEVDRDVVRGDTIAIELRPWNQEQLGDFVGINLNIIVCIGATRQPGHALMCPGGNATLSLEARTSYGTITYRWRKNGVPLQEGVKYRGVFGPMLTITNVSALDAAAYDCVLGSVCSTIPSHSATLTICPANFTCSGEITPLDIFTFMNAWFAADPRADISRNGAIDVQDIFDFVGAWFIGC